MGAHTPRLCPPTNFEPMEPARTTLTMLIVSLCSMGSYAACRDAGTIGARRVRSGCNELRISQQSYWSLTMALLASRASPIGLFQWPRMAPKLSLAMVSRNAPRTVLCSMGSYAACSPNGPATTNGPHALSRWSWHGHLQLVHYRFTSPT